MIDPTPVVSQKPLLQVPVIFLLADKNTAGQMLYFYWLARVPMASSAF